MRNNLIGLFFFGLLLAGCSATKNNKVEEDCAAFDKGFIEVCNKSCPPKCAEMASQSDAVKKKYSTAEIEEKCKTSCSTHCGIQLEKVKPAQCKPEKK